MASVIVLVLIVLACCAAPLYASRLSQTDPFQSNLDGQITIGANTLDVMQADTAGLGLGVTPIGPTWDAQYLLGADNQGRDVAARMLYGGRNSLDHLRGLDAWSACVLARRCSASSPASSGGVDRRGAGPAARRALGVSGLSAGDFAFRSC